MIQMAHLIDILYTDVNGTKTRQETYSADDELLNYWELNDVGEWVDYNADGTPVE